MKRLASKIRKYWLYPTLSLLILFSLVGCNNGAEPAPQTPMPEISDSQRPSSTPTEKAPSPTPTETKQPLKIDPAGLKGLSIRFVHSWSGEADQVIKDIATKFSLSNPWGIWVDVEAYGSESILIEKVQADIIRGQTPALIAAHPSSISSLEGDYTAISLQDYSYHPEWGLDADSQSDIPQVFLDPFFQDGQMIGLPVAPQAYVLFYNQTWGELLGFDSPPQTVEEFSEQICEATAANLNDKNEENDFTGGWLMNFDPGILLSWYIAFGGEVPYDSLPQFNNEAGQSAFSYLEDLYSPEKGCIWVGRQPEPYVYFVDRYALAYAGTLDQIPLQTAWTSQFKNDDQWLVTGFPGPQGEVMLVDGPGLFITESTPEEQLAAWLFAKHLLTPEIQARLVQSMFTLPVRKSAMDFLSDFTDDYPQWAESAAMIAIAENIPISEDWAYGQWMLQDAIKRLFAVEEEEVSTILEQLDQMILELEGTEQ